MGRQVVRPGLRDLADAGSAELSSARRFVLHPARWVPDGELVGAVSLFHHLPAWRSC